MLVAKVNNPLNLLINPYLLLSQKKILSSLGFKKNGPANNKATK